MLSNIDLRLLNKAFEVESDELETEFEFTKVFFTLQQTCPTHKIGEKDLELQRYKCPVRSRVLEKHLNAGGIVIQA